MASALSGFEQAAAHFNFWYRNSIPHEHGVQVQDEMNPGEIHHARNSISRLHAFDEETHRWNRSDNPTHFDSSGIPKLATQPQSPANTDHTVSLAINQDLECSDVKGKAQHKSPVSYTYSIPTSQGKRNFIACESCRKRKSKCNGGKPKCNACYSKNLPCAYRAAEDTKSPTRLQTLAKKLGKEIDDMKSIFSLLATTPNKSAAATWAYEVGKSGFAYYSAEEIRRALQEGHQQPHQPLEHEPLTPPEREVSPRLLDGHPALLYDGYPQVARWKQDEAAIVSQNDILHGTAPYFPNIPSDWAKCRFGDQYC